MKPKIAAEIALVVFFIALPAFSQPPSFDNMDSDRNGALSRKEVITFLTRDMTFSAQQGRSVDSRFDPNSLFTTWDIDGDGEVSRAEFDARPMGPLSEKGR